MATTSALPAPRIFSDRVTANGGNRRHRRKLGSVAGPGLLMWMMVNSEIGPASTLLWNVYYTQADLANLTDDTASTPIEGIPLLQTDLSSQGVMGVDMATSAVPTLIEPKAPLPSGSFFLYMVVTHVAITTSGLQMAIGYQQVPELGL